MSTFPAIGHVALTVTDLEASVTWYNHLFETEPAIDMSLQQLDRRIYALPGGQLLGLTQHKEGSGSTFDPTVTGLDHVGFHCKDREELQGWADYLTDHGVENKGIEDTDLGPLVSFCDPDGNAFDFFVLPG